MRNFVKREIEFHPLIGYETRIEEIEKISSISDALAICNYHEIASRGGFKCIYREYKELIMDFIEMGYQKERNVANIMAIEYPDMKYSNGKNEEPEKKRIKPLILKFDLRTLARECEREGWEIPSYNDVKGKNITHPSCWVTDKPEDKSLHETHGMHYIAKTDSLIVLNKNFMETSVVLVPC